MPSIASFRPRLIVIGAESSRDNEQVLASLSRNYETVLVDKGYSTWSARFADYHRVASYWNYGSLFNSVTDLMGEVPFVGTIALDALADDTLSTVNAKLGLSPTVCNRTNADEALPLDTDDFLIVAWEGQTAIAAWSLETSRGTCIPVNDAVVGQREDAEAIPGTWVSVQDAFGSREILHGLSPLLRSPLLRGVDDVSLSRIASMAFDAPARGLMAWTEAPA